MKKRLLAFVPATLPLLMFAGCTHRPGGGTMRGWDHMMGPGGYGGVVMWLVLILVLGVVIYFVLNRGRGAAGPTAGGSGESPLDILKRRYAEGEISREEFERMKREINPG